MQKNQNKSHKRRHLGSFRKISVESFKTSRNGLISIGNVLKCMKINDVVMACGKCGLKFYNGGKIHIKYNCRCRCGHGNAYVCDHVNDNSMSIMLNLKGYNAGYSEKEIVEFEGYNYED